MNYLQKRANKANRGWVANRRKIAFKPMDSVVTG